MNWEDIRLFLALARSGSARTTAALEGVSHTTVARRISQLEAALGARLFDRDVRDYRLTDAGETMLLSTVRAEESLLSAQRQLLDSDTQLRGEIRVTLVDVVAIHLMMPYLADFAAHYPDIDLNVLNSPDVFNLSRGEADVALRLFRLGAEPPGELLGRKLATIKSCYYGATSYLAKHDPWRQNSGARWIGWDNNERFPDWVKASPFPNIPAHGCITDAMLQAEGARCGLGLTVLPCFVADRMDGLQRIPKCQPHESFELWMLSHPDLRDTARLNSLSQLYRRCDRKKQTTFDR